ncbi:MAG: hypothetical protein OXP66_02390 [Candidatus Tectomicrobia bacterium]|nr:hypothetical protein [Candidatus Tectomicrobia bacterium]
MCKFGCVYSVVTVLVVLAADAAAQERESPSPYFDCPYVNYFDSDCPQLERDKESAAAPSDDDAAEPAATDEPEAEHDWLQEVPEHLLPLFPKESLAPDTPALYQLLLLRPTLANARRYVRWHSRRMGRIREAQELIAVAGREFLAGKAAE